MLLRVFVLCIAILFFPFHSAQGDENHTSHPEDHAPIGVMGEHVHKTGGWMVSYRYMKMDMSQLYAGTREIFPSDALNDFMITPIKMRMEMHMLGGMYAPSDELTLMLMLPYIIKDMEHRNRAGAQFSTRSAGIGDIKASGILSLKKEENHQLLLNFGISFPSGSVNRTDETLAGKNQPLPYPMQLGAGTFGILPGLTFTGKHEDWAWGAQNMHTFYVGKNTHKYRLGNRHEASAWLSYTLFDWLSSSVRVKGQKWGNISGADPRLNINMISTANPGLAAGERVDILGGVNILFHEGSLKGHRLALEVGYPLYVHLSGPQLGTKLHGTFGWQKAF